MPVKCLSSSYSRSSRFQTLTAPRAFSSRVLGVLGGSLLPVCALDWLPWVWEIRGYEHFLSSRGGNGGLGLAQLRLALLSAILSWRSLILKAECTERLHHGLTLAFGLAALGLLGLSRLSSRLLVGHQGFAL